MGLPVQRPPGHALRFKRLVPAGALDRAKAAYDEFYRGERDLANPGASPRADAWRGGPVSHVAVASNVAVTLGVPTGCLDDRGTQESPWRTRKASQRMPAGSRVLYAWAADRTTPRAY